ncbi:MAG: PAS domain-containing protein [Desulfuromonadaceae bacterium]|nr:PAS domain-containing protein [Desulfuromonadaceae bacterium]
MNKQLRTKSGKIRNNRKYRRTHQESADNYAYSVTVKDGVPVETIHQPGCERITGHTLEEFNTDSGLWYRIVHEDDRPLVFGMAKLMLADPDNHTLEYRILHKDGSIRWVSNTLAPSPARQNAPLQNNDHSGGTLMFYDGIVTEITRRKTIDEELTRRMEKKTFFRHGGCHANR